MKFLHLGDLHLGKRVYGYSMVEDQRIILEQILQLAKENEIDAILIAGDIYDKPIPPAEATALFDWFFTALCGEKITVLAVSGNHDSGERLDFGRRLLSRQGMHLAGTMTGKPDSVLLTDKNGCQVEFHLLPWLYPMEWREMLQLEKSSQQCAVQAALALADWTEQVRHVLIAHTFVTVGGELPAQSDSEIIPVGGVDAVDAALFERYDYTALGHLHRPQRLGRDSIRYAGSPLKYSFSEARYAKSVPLVTIAPSGEPKIELLPLLPRRDMREIRGTLEEVLSEAVVQSGNPEDYLRIILTDEEELYDPQSALKEVYPNLMRLDFDNVRTRAAETEGLEDMEKQLTPMELFADFFREQYGKDFTPWQAAVVERICRRMEDGYEAD